MDKLLLLELQVLTIGIRGYFVLEIDTARLYKFTPVYPCLLDGDINLFTTCIPSRPYKSQNVT